MYMCGVLFVFSDIVFLYPPTSAYQGERALRPLPKGKKKKKRGEKKEE